MTTPKLFGLYLGGAAVLLLIQRVGAVMTEQDVVTLMESSKSEAEWDANCDRVKKAFGYFQSAPDGGHEVGVYPDFWFRAIVLSGVAEKAIAGFR